MAPPKKILIATDLGPRSDRALDRAALLTNEFAAKLFVAHVLEEYTQEEEAIPSWRRPSDFIEAARHQLLQDVGAVARNATILIEQGEPANAILNAAEREGCDLIVTGVARNELFGRFSLGATVDGILRGARVPVLVVKCRAAKAYGHVVVATDFSECSRRALETVDAFFPDRKLTLFHAHDAPMSLLLSDPDEYRRERRKAAEDDCEAFLRTTSGNAETIVEFGAPDLLLRKYVLEKGVDLVALGTQGRSAVLEFLVGSVAKKIVSALPCDALLVRRQEA